MSLASASVAKQVIYPKIFMTYSRQTVHLYPKYVIDTQINLPGGERPACQKPLVPIFVTLGLLSKNCWGKVLIYFLQKGKKSA